MNITASLFDAFLKCPTKCWLRFTGEPPTGNTYNEWVNTKNESYRTDISKWLIANAPADERAVAPVAPVAESMTTARKPIAGDVAMRSEFRSGRHNETHTSASTSAQSLLTSATMSSHAQCTIDSPLPDVERIPPKGQGNPETFIPIHFVFRNKLTKDDRLLLAFDALVLTQTLGHEVNLGKIIHGDDQTTLKVKTLALAGEARKRLEKVDSLLSSPTPPDLVLNRHCAECEFQARCRQKALEQDDLSLLAGMSAKERQKLRSKGIFTITQLSYTFRPRRRAKRLRDKRERYHHSLKALAIREKKIHIVGSPELKIEGTPVYLDVEGLPDREFYYLIGLRIGNDESAVQHSLWAESVEEEAKIWREFLLLIATVENPVLVHYGSYETSFLKRMCDRHGGPPEGSTALNAVRASINLLSLIFAQIYFPGMSNGLKDTAGVLGFKWVEACASGLKAITWRCQWEELRDAVLKERLITYNTQDCEALGLVTGTVRQLAIRAGDANGNEMLSVVRADADNFAKRSKWRKFASPVLGFEYINSAAHWSYQRSRLSVRSGKVNQKEKCGLRRCRFFRRVDKIIVWECSRTCPVCNACIRVKGPVRSRTLQDILFGRHSLKRRLVKYVFQTYRCCKCGCSFGMPDVFRHCRRYGWNLVAYFFYQVVDLCIPQLVVVKCFNRTFGFDLSRSTLNNMKIKTAKYYSATKEQILERIIRGTLVHADETRANIKGKSAFVWVLTSVREVVYILSDSREGEIVQTLLADFNGVLISDFYTAYDSINCPQQKCLIHLIRDLNDEVLNNPFDEQLKQVVHAFGDLLKSAVETVDQHGLKKHFLQKHVRSVERFYRELGQADYQSEAASKCKKRFERNRDKLFTFLNYDGVPWNNNNAEHAVKAFARLRNIIAGSSTEQGVEEYLTLLSVCQTCKYMGVDFLDFLRSGEKDIHAFAESRHGRRQRTQFSAPTGLQVRANPDTCRQLYGPSQ